MGLALGALGSFRPGLAQLQTLNVWVLPAVPPQLLVAEGVGQVTTLVGQPLELPCQASGSPMPTIQCVWGGGDQGGGLGVCGQRAHALGSGRGRETLPLCRSMKEARAVRSGGRCCHAPWRVLPGLPSLGSD